jgi:hypothetical protein
VSVWDSIRESDGADGLRWSLYSVSVIAICVVALEDVPDVYW